MNLPISEGHSRRCRPTWVGLAAVWALAGLTVACSGDSVRGAASQGSAGIPVKVETAKLIQVRDTTEYVATLKSRDSAVIMPQLEGQITAIYVRSGTRVSQGTSLMQIDPTKQQTTLKKQEHTVAAKQAELEWAQKEYERNQGLMTRRWSATPPWIRRNRLATRPSRRSARKPCGCTLNA